MATSNSRSALPHQTPAIYTSYTSAINPPHTSPLLTRRQIWSALQLKIISAESFVPAITSTTVISRSHDSLGRPVTVRNVVFADGNKKVREEVTAFEPDKLVFYRPNDGSRVMNIVSEGKEGELYMTYDFEWLLPEAEGVGGKMGEKELEILGKKREQYRSMARMAVESSIEAIRGMVKEGKIE
jgi:Domain of unknown function (DUF1857)